MLLFNRNTVPLTKKTSLSFKVIPQTFDLIFLAPSPFDDESTDNFVSLKDITYDEKCLTSGKSILDVEGSTHYESTFTIDSETAIKANIRKARYAFYLTDPSSVSEKPQFIQKKLDENISKPFLENSKSVFKTSGGFQSTPPGNYSKLNFSPFPDKKSQERNIVIDRADPRKIPPRGGLKIDDGRIREIEIDLGITDKMVSDYNFWSQMKNSQIKADLIPPPLPEQTYVFQATEKVKIEKPAVESKSKFVKNIAQTMPAYTMKLGSELPTTDPAESAIKVLKSGIAPDAYMNGYYGAGPGAGPPAGGMLKSPVNYSIHGSFVNQTKKVSKKNTQGLPNGFSSVTKKQPKNSSQKSINNLISKAPSFTDQIKESVSLSPETLSTAYQVPLQEYIFKSSVLEFETEFEFQFTEINPKNTQFFVKVELLSKEGHVQYTKNYAVNLKEQLEPLLTPKSPPTISTAKFEYGRAEIKAIQKDPVASAIEIFRMMAPVDKLTEAKWERIQTVNANIADGDVLIVDESLENNYKPNVVLYEAKSVGPLGNPCPITSTLVENGVTPDPIAILPASVKGNILISASQKDTKIEIEVSDIPKDVFRIAIKRNQLKNSQDNKRKKDAPYVPLAGTSNTYFVDVVNTSSTLLFEDTGITVGDICKYYAVIDWKDGRRTYSITEEYIQYLSPPPPTVIHYLTNAVVDTSGLSPSISFDCGASLSEVGLQDLFEALGDSGTASLFSSEIEKDRSLVSDLLLLEVSRKNNKTEEIFTWPLVSSGRFEDSVQSNSNMNLDVPPLEPSVSYTYTMKVYIIDPEKIFSEAFTRIPATTRQIINNADPNFIQLSSQRFAEKFTIDTQAMESASTINRKKSASEKIKSSYSGLQKRFSKKIPEIKSALKNVSVQRQTNVGQPANVVKWKVEGNKSDVYAFKLDIVLEGGLKMPLASVSPNSFKGNEFSFRDESFVHENTKLSYEITPIYMDQTSPTSLSTKPIEGAISKNSKIVDRALQKQSKLIIPRTSPKDKNLSPINSAQLVEFDLKLASGLYDAPYPKDTYDDRDLQEESDRNIQVDVSNNEQNIARKNVLNLSNKKC